MRIRSALKVLGVMAVAMAPLSATGPAAHAANTAHCQIHGEVALNPGIDLTTPMNGTYNFTSTTIVCGGTVAGIASANSSGAYTDTGAGGTFSGTYSTGTFAVGGSCSGSVSGSRTGSTVVATLSGGCSGTVVLQFTVNPTCSVLVAGPPPHYVIKCAVLDGTAEITA